MDRRREGFLDASDASPKLFCVIRVNAMRDRAVGLVGEIVGEVLCLRCVRETMMLENLIRRCAGISGKSRRDIS